MENEEVVEFNKRIRGIMRLEHFQAGSRLDEWRGQHNVEVDKKKESSRKHCRKRNYRDDE
jgi:hypothetical protein